MPSARPRLRDLGHAVGRLATGERNALVDVPGVQVGHRTLVADPPDAPAAVRSGVTAILPHGGDLYAENVLGACHVVNGYGKATGLTQLAELGTIEAPLLLTSTLSVGPVWEGGLRHVLEGNPSAGREGTVNVIVGECFDGYLSDARALPVRAEDALEAIARAREDEVGEGSVGAGTGCHCLGFKAGVGTASRATEHGGHLLGSLVVANYGGGRDLHLLVEGEEAAAVGSHGGGDHAGSVMVVLATDAPLSERQLRRVSARATFGLGRAASYARNRSGDYVVGFSTAHRIPRQATEPTAPFRFLRDDSRALSDLFEAAAEATYEAVLNSLCVADAMEGRDGNRVEAFPHELLGRLRAG